MYMERSLSTRTYSNWSALKKHKMKLNIICLIQVSEEELALSILHVSDQKQITFLFTLRES